MVTVAIAVAQPVLQPHVSHQLRRSLPILAPVPAPPTVDGRQDCSTCRNLMGCWKSRGKKPLTDDAVVVNLLVCRIQRKIDVNRSVRALLILLRPKLKKMATAVAKRTGTRRADVVHDLESVAIETLTTGYVMGEVVPPIVWLFNGKHGALQHYVLRTLAKAKRERLLLSYDGGPERIDVAYDGETTLAYGDLEPRIAHLNRAVTHGRIRNAPVLGAADAVEPESDADLEIKDRVARALAVVEDGQTLTTNEYRVLKFCLSHARGAARPTDWLHRHLASVMGLPRQDVTRLYGAAYRKVVDAVGLRTAYLRARGIEEVRPVRDGPLPPEDILLALELMRKGATIPDVAFALGTTDFSIRWYRRRYARKAPAEAQLADA